MKKKAILILLSAMMITAYGCGNKTDGGMLGAEDTQQEVAAEQSEEDTATDAAEIGDEDTAMAADSTEGNGENESKTGSSDTAAEDSVDTGEEENSTSDDNVAGDQESDAKEAAEESAEAASDAESVTAEMTDYFITQVAKAAGVEPVSARYYEVNDFDGDGHYEAFVFVGGEVDEDWGSAEGTVWYVNEARCKQIHDEFSFAVFDGAMFTTIKAGDRKFVLFNDMYATSYVTNIYTVKNFDCVEANVSRVGSASYDESTGDMSITLSAYDYYCDYEAGSEEPMWTGHTWKPYYFYYDEASEEFKEYVGQEITESELAEICGFDLAKEIRDSGYTVDAIYKRDNGIVNVNYSKEDIYDDGSRSITYKNANFDQRRGEFLDAWGTGDTGYEASDFGGTYAPYI